MSEYQELEDTESQDPAESAIITEMRNRERGKDKELEKLRAQLAEVELAAQTQRAEAATEVVNTLGFPGLEEDVLTWIPGDISQEKVIEALTSRGIPLPEGTEKQTPIEQEAPSASDVGQRVADAAAGNDARSLDERLTAAESTEEINALMVEAGLTRSHS